MDKSNLKKLVGKLLNQDDRLENGDLVWEENQDECVAIISHDLWQGTNAGEHSYRFTRLSANERYHLVEIMKVRLE